MPAFSPEELAAWSGGAWIRRPGAPIRRIVHDTRGIRAGDLYVALRGARLDGHAFVAEAFAQGAAAALVDRAWAAGTSAPAGAALLTVDAPLAALHALARGHRARLRGRMVGVTGSLGKSTTKELLADCLASAGAVARNPGNWNNDIGVPLSLLAMDPDDAFGVFELGMNHAGELAPLCALLRPDWAVVTRVAPVHMEFFPDERAVAEEKAALPRSLPPSGSVVLAADEPWFEVLRAETRARVVTVAWAGAADYTARADPADPLNIHIHEPGGRDAAYRLSIPGEPMRRNALRAVACARELGIPPPAIAAALATFRPPPMRWSVSQAGGVTWINDAYNASRVSLLAALDTFAGMNTAGRKWIVLGGMRELGAREREDHDAVGRVAAAGPWAGLVTVGDRGAWIATAARESGWPAGRVWTCDQARAAAAVLAGLVEPGDAVLLKGSRAERVEEVFDEWERGRAAVKRT